MSAVKEILGDMTLEEIEALRNETLDKFKGADANKIIELCYSNTHVMYNCWLLIHGKTLANKWVLERGGYITSEEQIMDMIQYLGNSFVEWLEDLN